MGNFIRFPPPLNCLKALLSKFSAVYRALNHPETSEGYEVTDFFPKEKFRVPICDRTKMQNISLLQYIYNELISNLDKIRRIRTGLWSSLWRKHVFDNAIMSIKTEQSMPEQGNCIILLSAWSAGLKMRWRFCRGLKRIKESLSTLNSSRDNRKIDRSRRRGADGHIWKFRQVRYTN